MKKFLGSFALSMSLIVLSPIFADGPTVEQICETPKTKQLQTYCALYAVANHMGAGEQYTYKGRCIRQYFSAAPNQLLAIRLSNMLLPDEADLRKTLVDIFGVPPLLGPDPITETTEPVMKITGDKDYYMTCSYTNARMYEALGVLKAKILLCNN